MLVGTPSILHLRKWNACGHIQWGRNINASNMWRRTEAVDASRLGGFRQPCQLKVDAYNSAKLRASSVSERILFRHLEIQFIMPMLFEVGACERFNACGCGVCVPLCCRTPDRESGSGHQWVSVRVRVQFGWMPTKPVLSLCLEISINHTEHSGLHIIMKHYRHVV